MPDGELVVLEKLRDVLKDIEGLEQNFQNRKLANYIAAAIAHMENEALTLEIFGAGSTPSKME